MTTSHIAAGIAILLAALIVLTYWVRCVVHYSRPATEQS